MWRHEGHTTTLQGVWLDPFTVVDANVQRDLIPGIRGFVSVENLGNTQYQINLSAAGAAVHALTHMPSRMNRAMRDPFSFFILFAQRFNQPRRAPAAESG